jgi:hypothetical protein
MTSAGHRSYVIRAWTRPSDAQARTHVRIERVESGEQVDLRGAAANRLAAAVEAAIREASLDVSGDEGALSDEPGLERPADDLGRGVTTPD